MLARSCELANYCLLITTTHYCCILLAQTLLPVYYIGATYLFSLKVFLIIILFLCAIYLTQRIHVNSVKRVHVFLDLNVMIKNLNLSTLKLGYLPWVLIFSVPCYLFCPEVSSLLFLAFLYLHTYYDGNLTCSAHVG